MPRSSTPQQRRLAQQLVTPAASALQAVQGYNSEEDYQEAEEESNPGSIHSADPRYEQRVPDEVAYQPEAERTGFGESDDDYAPSWMIPRSPEKERQLQELYAEGSQVRADNDASRGRRGRKREA